MDEKERQRRIKILREKRRRKRKIKRNIILCSMLLAAIFVVVGIVKVIGHISNTDKQAETVQNEQNLKTTENQSTTDTVDTLQQLEFTESTPEEAAEISLTISLAGDCTLGQDENQSGNTFPVKYNEVNDPSYFFSGVQDAFANDDLTIVNFEGTLTESNNRVAKTYAFKGDPSYVNILTQGSIEAVNLANNHSQDYGVESYTDTKKYLDEANITHFGYDETAVIEVKGTKIGLIGIMDLFTGIECKSQLLENIEKVKAEGAVLIIVSFHWGTEKEAYPDEIQKELAHTAIDNGADLVVGHHPHVLQGIETYNGKKIVYSLGNFCFGGNKNPSDKDTMIFQQTFTVKGDQVLEDENINVIPCSLSSVSSYNDYHPIILEGTEAQRVLDKINERSAGI